MLDVLQVAEDELPALDDVIVASRTVHLPLSWDDPATREAIERYMRSVRDDAPWCPWNIEFIRRINGLESVDDVRRIVFDAEYLVLGLGDVYLGAPVAVPVDPRHRLVTTKYNPARTWTPENAVGIGGAYLCVYGMEGPGGYQFVGRTVPVWSRYGEGREFRPRHTVAAAVLRPDPLASGRVRTRCSTCGPRRAPGASSSTSTTACSAAPSTTRCSAREPTASRRSAVGANKPFDAERAAWEQAGEFARVESAASRLGRTAPGGRARWAAPGPCGRRRGRRRTRVCGDSTSRKATWSRRCTALVSMEAMKLETTVPRAGWRNRQPACCVAKGRSWRRGRP